MHFSLHFFISRSRLFGETVPDLPHYEARYKALILLYKNDMVPYNLEHFIYIWINSGWV